MATANRELRRMVHLALWGTLFVFGASAQPAAAGTLDVGTVQATTTGSNGTQQVNSAPYQAPSTAPLHATQPTSVINRHYIEHNVVASSNYDEVIKNTPSVMSIAPNGPGLMENMGLSIRGFQDGEYNVLFDGIPWSDSNDFTHHSTSYFMANDLGQASVDRGPGTASTIGTSTFGGTVSLHSKNPLQQSALTPYTTLGSFGTHLFGVEYDTGSLPQYNGASGFIDFERLDSNGYLTNSGQSRSNIFTKVVRPVGNNTLITVAVMYNKIHQNVPVGATKAQIDLYGPNYALSKDPTSQNYYGYNYDNIHSDFEYLGLNSVLGNGWTVDNKLYTYAYYHRGFNGLDPNGEDPNTTFLGGAGHVPGEKMGMDYRSYGDIARFTKQIDIGKLKTGLWVDHQYNTRFQYKVDWTLDGAIDGPNATERLMNDSLDNIQPYVELDWKAAPNLVIQPGLKYAWFRRKLDAQVNQKTGTPLSYSKTYDQLLPSLIAHYTIHPGWTAYAQVAKGFLAPNLNTYYTADPGASNVKPESTVNYQVGTTWQTRRLALSADAYYIDFNNKVNHRTVGSNTIFYNEGGVIYKGLEFEGTYYAGMGFSLYGNATANSAKTKGTHQWIANAPKTTAAAGVIYNRNGWYGSLIDKYVGKRYGDDGQVEPLGAYSVADLSIGYTFKQVPSWVQKASIKFQVNNLANSHKIDALAGYTDGANTPLYWTIPERSYYVSLSARF